MDNEAIQKVVSNFASRQSFQNLNVKFFCSFTETSENILSNYTSHKTVRIDCKYPKQMKSDITSAKIKNKTFEKIPQERFALKIKNYIKPILNFLVVWSLRLKILFDQMGKK